MSTQPIQPIKGTGIMYIPFQIDQLTKDSRFIIGIGEDKKINTNGVTYYLKENCYGFHNNAYLYSHDKSVEYALELEKQSKCAIKLDFVKDEVSYVINDLNRGVAFTKCGLKNTKFHLLV